MIISDVQNKVLTLRRDKIFSGDYSAVGPIIAVFTHSNKIACCHFAFSWIHSNLLERMAEGNPLPVQYESTANSGYVGAAVKMDKTWR